MVSKSTKSVSWCMGLAGMDSDRVGQTELIEVGKKIERTGRNGE